MSYRILVGIAEDSACRIGRISDKPRCTMSHFVTTATDIPLRRCAVIIRI